MKGSLIVVSIFILGIIIGLGFDDIEQITSYNRFVIYGLMFIVGISIGADRNILKALRNQSIKSVFLPLATIIGSLTMALLISPLVTGMTLCEILAVASGFGYYSLSTIMITEYSGAEIGTIGLVANIVREISSLVAAPLMVRYFSPLSVISSAGATSIDSLLPTITKFSGKEYAVLAIFHGIVLELAVPILVSLFIG